jgi:hypothetical protein
MMLMPFSAAAAGFAYETTILTVLYCTVPLNTATNGGRGRIPDLFHVGSNFIRSQGLIASQRMKQKRIHTNQHGTYSTVQAQSVQPALHRAQSTSKSLDPQNPQLLKSQLLNSSFFILQTLLSFSVHHPGADPSWS